MLNHFTFNGHSTAEYGLLVTALNPYSAPSRRIEKVEIPYRNGDLVIDSGVYNNIIVSYEVSVINNTKDNFEALRNWLLTSQGYHQLSDTINTDSFRVGCYYQSVDATLTALYKYGKAVISFDCFPQRYLTTNTPITTTATADTTTDITLSLSTVPTPLNISLNGNTTQEGSSGKNLLGLTNGTYTHNGITAVVSDGLVTYSGSTNSTDQALIDIPIDIISSSLGTLTKNLQPTGTYTGLQTSLRGSNPNTSAGLWSNNGSNNTGTLSENAYYFRIQVGVNITVNGKILPQIEKGSTETAFEPHISPTNPQPIHSVSGDNEITVSGKNIAKFGEPYFTAGVNYTHTENSINISANGTYARVGYSFQVETGKQYSISFKAVKSNGSYGIIHVDNNNSWNNSYGGFTLTTSMAEYTKTLTANTDILFIGFYVTSNMTTGTMTVNDFMIEVNSTATTYEPYTRQNYPLYLPVENYFDLNTVYADTQYFTIDGDSVTSNYFSVARCYIPSRLVGKKCTFQAYIYSNPTTVNMRVRANINGTNTDGNYIRYGEEGISSVSFTPTSTSDYVHVTYSEIGGMVTIKNVMLSEGNLNHYTPYGTTPIELNKVGTYQDYIYKNGGKWYVHKATASVDMGTLTYQTDNGGVYFYSSVSGKGRTNFDLLCTCYTVTTSTNTSGMTDYQIKGQTSGAYIFIKDSRYTVATDLKTALSGQTLKYNLATATNTEITDTTLINQLNNIEKAYSYNGTTNILQVSNDNGFMLGVVSLHSNDVSSAYKGEPIITVNSTGLIYFNGCVIKVNQAPMTINSQTMQAYNGTVNLNNYIEANDFPMIEAGNNVIGSEMPLSIVPNYWKL